jgi:hypothetical protein
MTSPLLPIDSHGSEIFQGCLVRIPVIPDWLASGLPVEDIEALRQVEGTIMRVLEIDRFGYLWFGSATGGAWFCLRPTDVKRMEVQ